MGERAIVVAGVLAITSYTHTLYNAHNILTFRMGSKMAVCITHSYFDKDESLLYTKIGIVDTVYDPATGYYFGKGHGTNITTGFRDGRWDGGVVAERRDTTIIEVAADNWPFDIGGRWSSIPK